MDMMSIKQDETDIDEAIKKESLWKCWMILTSRATEQIKDIREYIDAEAEIQGFDSTGVWNYVRRSLRNDEKANRLMGQAQYGGLFSNEGKLSGIVLAIPIILNMICVLFKFHQTLPNPTLE